MFQKLWLKFDLLEEQEIPSACSVFTRKDFFKYIQAKANLLLIFSKSSGWR